MAPTASTARPAFQYDQMRRSTTHGSKHQPNRGRLTQPTPDPNNAQTGARAGHTRSRAAQTRGSIPPPEIQGGSEQHPSVLILHRSPGLLRFKK